MTRARPDGTDIRAMTLADRPAVASALAAAFFDDPVLSWVVPGARRRRARMERFFALGMDRLWLAHGEGFTHDEHVGAALWVAPGAWHLGVLDQARAAPALARAFGRDLPRLAWVGNALERRHPKAEHWYLPIVGVDPAHQGRGFGEALMRPMLDRCDAEGTPAYLEASSERSRPLYERLGFVVTEELRYARNAPPLWAMWREPA